MAVFACRGQRAHGVGGSNMLPWCVGDIGPACKSTVDRFHLDLAFFRDKTFIDKGGGGTGVIILLNLFADIAGEVIEQEKIHGRDCKRRYRIN